MTADNQRLEIEGAGHQVDYWFSDTISGKTSVTQRPQFAALLAQIRNGETLVVSKLDRLGRDAVGAGRNRLQSIGQKQTNLVHNLSI